MTVLDSHLHLWDPARFDYPWLSGDLDRPYLPGDLDSGGVQRAVFVEAGRAPQQGFAEAEWVAALADVVPEIVGIVAFAAVDRGDAVTPDLERLRSIAAVRGVRRLLQGEPDDLLASGALVDGLAAVGRSGLTFDACVTWNQLPALELLLRRVPDLQVVLDHLGKPPVAAGLASAEGRLWRAGFRRLAAHETVVVKLSGLAPEAGPGVDLAATAAPFLDDALDVFGADRCLVGSDWPVSAVAWERRSYASWFSLVLDRLSGADRDAVAHRTADRVYRLA